MATLTGRLGVAVLSSVVAVGARPVAAQFLGSEFRVNTTTTLYQRVPSAAFDASGNFVVVWQSGSAVVGHAVFGQRYSSSGVPLAGEFQVNTDTVDSFQPAVASDAAGNFVVVWTSKQALSSYDVLGQRFDSGGAPRGSAFRVNTYTTGGQYSATVASDSTGDFLVAWRSNDQNGAGSVDVFGQRYSSSGEPSGLELEVSAGGGAYPSVASDAAGNFVVAWSGSSGVYGQRFSSSGVASGPFIATAAGAYPSVASNGAGDFVIAWQAGDGSYSGIFARRYAPGGAALGSSFRVNSFTSSGQAYPRVAIGESRAFAVTWTSSGGLDGSRAGVFGRGFSSTGIPLGQDVRINTYTTDRQNFSAVATDGVGHFVVVWESYGQDAPLSWGVYAQRFDFCRPGDVDNSNTIDVADVFYLINSLFAGGPPPVCSGDMNGNGTADVADVFYLINYLFAGGPPPL